MKNEFFVQGKETKRFSHCERVLRKAKRDVRSMLFHGDDYFSFGMSFFKIPQSFRNLT